MAPTTVVGRGGFEPPKAYASRFTVCPLWPLGYLPESAGTHLATPRKSWRWREDLNPRPTAYKAVALPLSYASTDKTSLYCRHASPSSDLLTGSPAGVSPRREPPLPRRRRSATPPRPASGSSPGNRTCAPPG